MKTRVLPLLIFLFLIGHALGQKNRIVEGLRFTEGPAISPEGELLKTFPFDAITTVYLSPHRQARFTVWN